MEDTSKRYAPITKKPRAFESVALIIKKAIFRGDWKPGNKLPSENELANQFNVSRHTIREALRTLELSGFLEIKTGISGGPIINDSITTVISNLYFDAFQMKSVSVEEFVSARLVIEKAVIKEVCKKISGHHVEKLKTNIHRSKELIKKKKSPAVLNFEFHSLLASASQNRIFLIFEKGILSIMQNLRIENPVNFNTSKSATLDHEKILNALIEKNDEAVNLMQAHLMRIEKSFLKNRYQ